jgi:hypothetical protein
VYKDSGKMNKLVEKNSLGRIGSKDACNKLSTINVHTSLKPKSHVKFFMASSSAWNP